MLVGELVSEWLHCRYDDAYLNMMNMVHYKHYNRGSCWVRTSIIESKCKASRRARRTKWEWGDQAS